MAPKMDRQLYYRPTFASDIARCWSTFNIRSSCKTRQ